MRSPELSPGRCCDFAFFPTQKCLYGICIFIAFGAIRGLQADLDMFVVGASNYKLELTTAALEYYNPEYMGEGGYFRTFRKSRNASTGLYAFWPVIKDLPAGVNSTFMSYRKLSNKWVESFVAGTMKVCDQIETKIRFFRFFYENSNFPDKCPVKKDNYTVVIDNFDKVSLPPGLSKNEWKVKFKWFYNKVTIMVNWFQFKVGEKQGRRPRNHH